MNDPRDFETVVRNARVVHGAMLVSLFVYALLPEFLRVRHAAVEPVILYALAAVALGSAVALLLVRSRMVDAAADRVRTAPDDVTAHQRWMAGNIFSFALAESVGLYGFVLRMLGAPIATAAVFYAAAVLLMLYSTPRRP